ncbi:MAG: PKD domain-containing protein, partial [Catalinimonas sp.]
YTITLRAENALGDARTFTRTVRVLPGPDDAACNGAAFVLPENVCGFDTLRLQNDSDADLFDFTWDFCAGELAETPTSSTRLGGLSGDFYAGLAAAKSLSRWHLFVPLSVRSQDSPRLVRYDLNSIRSSVVTQADLGNFGGALNNPGATDILAVGSDWLGFVANRNDDRIVRLDFGRQLTNDPEATVITAVGRPDGDLRAVHDLRDGVVLLASSRTDNQMFVHQFGDGPMPIRSQVVPGTQRIVGTSGLGAFGLIRDCARWYALVHAPVPDRFYLLDFGASLLGAPVVTNITDRLPGITAVNAVRLVRDGGRLYAFIMQDDGQIKRADFGDDLLDIPTVTTLPELGLNRAYGLDFLQDESQFLAFVVDNALGNAPRSLKELTFPETCGVASPLRAGRDPGAVVFRQPGVRQVSLTALDQAGNLHEFTQPVEVRVPARPDFVVTGGRCPGRQITFTNTTVVVEGRVASLLWSFGDGTTSADQQPTHTYTEAGTYQVSLRVFSSTGCQATVSRPVQIDPAPLPGFSFSATPCSNNTVLFNDLTQTFGEPIESRRWTFGDVGSSEERNPAFVFTEAGTYDVTLTVLSAGGCDTSVTQTITLATGPAVDFTINEGDADTLDICEGDELRFAAAVDLNGTTAMETIWNFGDGTTSSAPNPVYTYTEVGFYEVSLAVENTLGCRTTRKRLVRVRAIPAATFRTTGNCANSTTTFAISSIVSDGDFIATWDYGDGTTGAGEITTHAYDQPGTYTATLTVTTQFGCDSTLAQAVTIAPSPEAAFAFDLDCDGRRVRFTNEGTSGGAVSYFWRFNDPNSTPENNISFEENPTHMFSRPGTYRVELSVDGTGTSTCGDTTSRLVTVSGGTRTVFSWTNTCAGETTRFFDLSDFGSDTIVSYSWNFGGLGFATEASPAFRFPSPGTYDVLLAVRSRGGCEADTTIPVTISARPTAAFTFDGTVGAPPFVVSFTSTSQDADFLDWDFGDGQTGTGAEVTNTYAAPGTYEVQLIAQRSASCADTIRETIEIIEEALYGVALTNLQVGFNGDVLVARADLTNEGTAPLTALSFTTQLGPGVTLQEAWMGLLRPGETQVYTFPARVLSAAGGRLPFYCVAAALPDGLPAEATDTLNNEACAVIEDRFRVFEPYPNPAAGQVQVVYTLPEAGDLAVGLYNVTGREVQRYRLPNADAGVYYRTVSLADVRPGVYYLSFDYAGERVLRKLVVVK